MTLQLTGYFDYNFGDDYMMKIIVHHLPEIEFVIEKNEKISRLLLEEKNVRIISESEKAKYPVLVVIGSGFMVNSRKALETEIKWFLKKRHPGDFCLGCNIEPFKNKLSEILIRHKLNKFRLIVCRDKASFDWLSKNVKSEVRYLPDILFSFPEEWLKKSTKKNALGISVMNIGKDGFNYYKKMAEVADYYIKETGNKVLLLAFNSGDEDDITACKTVRDMMDEKTGAEIISHGDKGEITDACARCRKIIATRFHSAVLALRMGIDMYPIIFRKKTAELLSDTGYTGGKSRIENVDVSEIKKFLLSEKSEFNNSEMFFEENKYSQLLRDFLIK